MLQATLNREVFLLPGLESALEQQRRRVVHWGVSADRGGGGSRRCIAELCII